MFQPVKDLRITNKDVVRLVNERAKRENRSAHNAAIVTILESLGPKSKTDNTKEFQKQQSENQSASAG